MCMRTTPPPTETYWQLRLDAVARALNFNNFDARVVDDAEAAHALITEEIVPQSGSTTIAFGGSMSMGETDVAETLKNDTRYQVIDTLDHTVPLEEKIDRRRRALLSDCFITGTNAITEQGHLVNLDMYGNRVAAMAFGPVNVIVVAGRNKIVTDLQTGMRRIKDYAAPANAMRLGMNTPCAATSRCADCASPERICNVWTVQEKSFPQGRVRVVLVNDDLGL